MKSENTLLIAEDEQDVRELLVEKLKTLGFPIVTAVDGQEMFERAVKDTSIVAILSDIRMPNRSGLDVLKALRSRDIETPLVFLTAFGDKNMVIEALRFGALDFLEKPWNGEQLLRIVKQALEIGVKLKDVEFELDLLAAKYKVAPQDMDKFRAIQKSMLLMKLKNEVIFKKKVG